MNIEELLGIEIPCDLQAEQAALGAILLDETTGCFETAKGRLQGAEFHDKNHMRIFKAMASVNEAGSPIDFVTVTSQLQDSDELEIVGGVIYLMELRNAVSTTANIEFYVNRVEEKFLMRQAIQVSSELLQKAAEQQDFKAFVAIAEKSFGVLKDRSTPVSTFKTMKQTLMTVWDQAEHRYNTREQSAGVTGQSSGFIDLDKMTKGFQRSDLIILAARPSVGKTAFALNVAQNVGVNLKETVAIFSLEMGADQLVTRMMSTVGSIDAEKLKTGFFEGDDWEKMSLSMSLMSEANIFIDDTPTITVHDIRTKCRKLQKEKGLGLILIDYLQLIQGRSGGKGNSNRQEEVSEISRTLKQLARELDVPIIALSQLSRGVEQRQDKRPMMSDLRESGSIEQDADIVAFLYRDDYYDKKSDKKNIIEIIIAKHRNGPLGTVELAFMKQYGKFLNLDRSHQEQQKAF
ncbi:Replicative DNA helicase [Paenibacillus allorhizoplanae]|uniref:Replicative DNA helicase n=1 Tax=Paenibacillus allorhizoplanae TaxID=2905648 RepID=A0ABM9CK06_9BACL|nr:Replicative DNA helicase [Paenibacillus allorhizoplanae]